VDHVPIRPATAACSPDRKPPPALEARIDMALRGRERVRCWGGVDRLAEVEAVTLVLSTCTRRCTWATGCGLGRMVCASPVASGRRRPCSTQGEGPAVRRTSKTAS
jgi:hypothetical protein